jgi:hypothetical protein
VTVEEGQACPVCRSVLHGRYCHQCGQDSHARPRPLRDWAAEAFSEANLVDGRTARTLAALAIRPGRLLQAWRDGAGTIYQTPTKLFIVVTAVFLLALNFADVRLYQYVSKVVNPAEPVIAAPDPDGTTVHLENATQRELWMQRLVDPAVDPAVTTAIQAAADHATTERDRQNLIYDIQSNREQAIFSDRLAAWLPNMLWLLMPLYALLLAPLFGRHRLLMEHLAFAMWAHVMAFSLLMLLALANKFGAALPAWPLVFPYLGYFVLAAGPYYGVSGVQALWRGATHLGLYVGLVLIPAAIFVAFTALDLEAFSAFYNA